MNFDELKNTVEAAGLYKRTLGKYFVYTILVLCGVFLALYITTLTDNIYVQILNGCFFGFVLVQMGMLGHDLSHGQVFSSRTKGHFWGTIAWGLFGGLSEAMWYDKHNAHHKHVNHEGLDPDLDVPFIFSDVQRANKSVFVKKFIMPYQHLIFFPMLPLIYFGLILQAFKKVFSSFSLINVWEIFLIIVHFAIFFFIPFYFLPFFVATAFCMAMALFSGAYMGIIFAPNHKGEEVVTAEEETTWLHQITLTRNLYPSWIGLHIFGGLNLQIEHHLFPEMSRYNYPRARVYVKAFCAKHNIRYYETSWFGSMKEIYISLRDHST